LVLEKLWVHGDLQLKIYFNFCGFGCSGQIGHIFLLYVDGKRSTAVLLCLESFRLRFELQFVVFLGVKSSFAAIEYLFAFS
jgi:hypothetical protein